MRTWLLAFIVILLCAVEEANASRHTALSRRRLVQRHIVTPTSVSGGASSIEAEEAASAGSPSSGPEEVVIVLHSSKGDLYLDPSRQDNGGPCLLGSKPYHFVKEMINSNQFTLKSVDTKKYMRCASGHRIVCDMDKPGMLSRFSIQDGGIFCMTGRGRDRWFNEDGAVRKYKSEDVRKYKSKDGLENGFKLEPVQERQKQGVRRRSM